MNILYIHGFGSKFDPDHKKVVALSTIGTVYGVNVDYTMGQNAVDRIVKAEVAYREIDVIVGTSMGGYTAANVGSQLNIPFVAINPAINPAESLQQYVGHNVDWSGHDFTLVEHVVNAYTPITQKGNGLVLLDRKDTVISAAKTAQLLDHCFEVIEFEGGCHRFDHIMESLAIIKAHVSNVMDFV